MERHVKELIEVFEKVYKVRIDILRKEKNIEDRK